MPALNLLELKYKESKRAVTWSVWKGNSMQYIRKIEKNYTQRLENADNEVVLCIPIQDQADQERFLIQPPGKKNPSGNFCYTTGLSETKWVAVSDCIISKCLNKNGLLGKVWVIVAQEIWSKMMQDEYIMLSEHLEKHGSCIWDTDFPIWQRTKAQDQVDPSVVAEEETDGFRVTLTVHRPQHYWTSLERT